MSRPVLTFFAFVAFVALGCSWSAPAAKLNASVRHSAYGVAVTNGSKVNYEDVTIKLNYGLTNGEYTATVQGIKAGETVTVPYFEFTDSSNTRFSYATTKVDNVMVKARVGGSYTWEEFSTGK